ncbi:hypothetical protein [Streptosporangium sandarakinum]
MGPQPTTGLKIRTTYRPEGRGPWTLACVNDDSSHLAEIRCLFRDGDIAAAGGSTPGPGARPLPPVPAGSARAALGSVVSSGEESVRIVTGRVGAGVVGLELSTEAKGGVTATVTGGCFTAWWPDAPTTEERENASPRGPFLPCSGGTPSTHFDGQGALDREAQISAATAVSTSASVV